ncbi:pyridoxal phosphate-dependent aminotransferase [Gemmatimonadota bacterium]
MRRYPGNHKLEEVLADRLEVGPDRVLVTNGSNDALDRACRTVLTAGREMIVPVPTFAMLLRYARLTGADLRSVPWFEGSLPVEPLLAVSGASTSAVGLTSPNNPTGAVISPAEVESLSRELPGALIILDLAYIEFADEDVTREALALPNVVVIRTLSKAWDLAGLRVGYAIGPPGIITWMRRAGQHYPVSGLSAALAMEWLKRGEEEVGEYVNRVRRERSALSSILRNLGAVPFPSQANFVLARFPDASGTFQGLAEAGIAVRTFPGTKGLEDCLRITCPGEADQFERLIGSLTDILTDPLKDLRDREPASAEKERS